MTPQVADPRAPEPADAGALGALCLVGRATAILGVAFIAATTAITLVTGSLPFAIVPIVVATFAGATLVAIRLVGAGRTDLASGLIAWTSSLAPLPIALLVPRVAWSLVGLPLLGFSIVLLAAGDRRVGRLGLVAGLATAAIAVVALVERNGAGTSSVPPAVLDAYALASVVAIAGLKIAIQWLVRRRLRRAAADAAAANRAKTDFLATVSHELRTPLVGILGMVDLLDATDLDAAQREHVAIIRSSGSSLLRVLGDILEVATLEARDVVLAPADVDLRRLADELLAEFAVSASEAGDRLEAVLDPTIPVRVRVDEARLRQVLGHLLGNAVKFTANGLVRLELRALDRRAEGARIRFEVRDDGIGIPAEVVPALFEPFHQADGSMSRRYGGTGTGLAISRRIVEALGGRLFAASGSGVGSRFWFDLDLDAAAAIAPRDGVEAWQEPAWSGGGPAHGTAEGAAAAMAAVRTLEGLRVLVVDDNPINLKVAAGHLRRLGCVVIEATGGAQAVERATGDVDVILMDCQMPDVDGFEATRRIRAAEEAAGRSRRPILALTANALPADRSRSLAAGMDDHLAKPVSIAALASAIRRQLGTAPDARPSAGSTDVPVRALGGHVAGDVNADARDAVRAAWHAGADAHADAHADEPILDPDILDELEALGGVEVIDELRTMLAEQAVQVVGEIRRGQATGDVPVVQSAAHLLKGSAGAVGAARLAAVAREIDAIAKGGSLEGLGGEVDALDALVEPTIAALAQWTAERAA